MESSAEIGKIKNEAEKLNEEARLEVLSEQDRQAGFAGSSEYEGNERVSEPGKVRVREVREAVVADLNGERFSAGENPEIRQAAGGVRSVNHAEDVKKVITDTLSKESYAPAEGMKIKPPADQSIQLKIRAAQRTKAVRDAFMEFGSRINEVWELLNVKKDSPEKGSVYYKQMRDAAEWVKVLTGRLRENEEDPEHSKSAAPSEGTLVEAMMRLSETSHIYYDTHRGWRAFKKGENRKEACSRIRDITYHFFNRMGLKLNNEGLIDRHAAISLEGEDEGKAESRLKELVKYYKKWRKHFAFNEADERANIKAKTDLFAAYEHEIKVYRAVYEGRSKDMDPDIAEIIDEARYYKIQNSVLERFENDRVTGGDVVREIAKEHTDELDYKEKAEEELSDREVDRDLTDEQLAAVEKIDRWFIRNYNNGGLVGRPLNIKNHHGEIVSELMSRTKRERLFIYYLIETGARKNPKVFDAYASQTEYKPDVDKLKKQMIASKLKLMSRLVGGYVYMHKLTEALQINRDYKELIKDSAKITRIDKEGKKEEELVDPVEKRSLMLRKAYISCNKYKQKAEECSKANGDGKKALEAQAAECERQYKADLDALIRADDAVGEAAEKYGRLGEDGEKSADRVNNRADDNKVDFKSNMDTYFSAGSAAAENLGTGVNAAVGTADLVASKLGGGVSWRLADSELARMSKYANGYTASTIAGLGHAMAMMYGIYNLYENGAKMHGGDIGREVTGILKSGASSFISYRKGVELVQGFSEQVKNFDAGKEVKVSSSLKIANTVTAGTGIMINAYDMISSELNYNNADNAARYLNRKYQAKKDRFRAEKEETAEQRRERLKEIKETRYEQDMIKLSRNLSDHKSMYSAYESVTNTVSMVSVVIPGIGAAIAAAVGFIGGVTVSILNAVDMGSIREALFDNYFHFNEFMEKVKSRLDDSGRKIYDEKEFRERMRRKLAAAAGYSDMISAADQITKRYADQVCSKLFGEGGELSENDRNGYIQLIKSFGLPYDEKKKIPDARLLAKKMSGR